MAKKASSKHAYKGDETNFFEAQKCTIRGIEKSEYQFNQTLPIIWARQLHKLKL
jgi:hypothetical protein